MWRFVVVCFWFLGTSESRTCPAPEYTTHDGVIFTPNQVHISEGDQGIVQCVVEFYQQSPPQTFMYVDDCKMMGFDHPSWITKIMQTDGPCSHTDSSKLCRTLTMYIDGTAEADNSRVYCCARLGGRVCSPNSTISLVGAPQPTPSAIAPESVTESCTHQPKPTITHTAGPSRTPAVTPLSTPSTDTQVPTVTANTDFAFSSGSHTMGPTLTLPLLLSLMLANSLIVLFL